jgi:hypothetical protein
MPSRKSTLVVSLATLAALVLATSSPRAQDGMLGIYFDTSGSECSGTVPTASFATLYVLLLPEGATTSGAIGAEFRIETPAGGAFFFSGEQAAAGANVFLGSAFGDGANIAFPVCQSGSAVPILSFQVFSSGVPASDAVLRVRHRLPPSDPMFTCPVAVLCDAPTYSEVCTEGGLAVLNPSGQVACGSSRIDSQWSRVKDLYRP